MSDNNQAEQTMPELPKAWGFARNVDGQIEIRIGPVCPPNRSGGLATPWAPMFGGDQMHQYARDYAAMLAAAPAASGGEDTSPAQGLPEVPLPVSEHHPRSRQQREAKDHQESRNEQQ